MSLLNAINNTGLMTNIKERVKLISLDQNVNHEVVNLKQVTTKFGRQILVEFSECAAFLPKRVADAITDECLTELNSKKLVLIIKEHKQTPNGLTPLVELIEV